MKRQAVDVVVLDLHLPDTPGLTVLETIHERWPEVPVIILSGPTSIDNVIRALRRGKAFDFLRKPLADMQILEDTIKAALKQHGRMSFPSTQVQDLDLTSLTSRERDLLACLCNGLSNQAIADSLSISEKSVRNRLSGVYAKLGVSNRTELLVTIQKGTPMPPSD
jgi:DNA-binding NarL/FixJ family response regulator